ncbi:MAG TPA: methylamine utilization protein, partial [Aquabacterium sp.]|nr:methylamine utilization protein [Aquabacterium sp.]
MIRPFTLSPPLARFCLGIWLSVMVLQGWAASQRFQILDATGRPLSSAAISVFVKGTPATATGKTVDMGQRDKKFAPPLIVIQTGTAVNFPNFDTVRHHVYSFSPIKPFEIKLYSGRPSAPVTFDKA